MYLYNADERCPAKNPFAYVILLMLVFLNLSLVSYSHEIVICFACYSIILNCTEKGIMTPPTNMAKIPDLCFCRHPTNHPMRGTTDQQPVIVMITMAASPRNTNPGAVCIRSTRAAWRTAIIGMLCVYPGKNKYIFKVHIFVTLLYLFYLVLFDQQVQFKYTYILLYLFLIRVHSFLPCSVFTIDWSNSMQWCQRVYR